MRVFYQLFSRTFFHEPLNHQPLKAFSLTPKLQPYFRTLLPKNEVKLTGGSGSSRGSWIFLSERFHPTRTQQGSFEVLALSMNKDEEDHLLNHFKKPGDGDLRLSPVHRPFRRIPRYTDSKHRHRIPVLRGFLISKNPGVSDTLSKVWGRRIHRRTIKHGPENLFGKWPGITGPTEALEPPTPGGRRACSGTGSPGTVAFPPIPSYRSLGTPNALHRP